MDCLGVLHAQVPRARGYHLTPLPLRSQARQSAFLPLGSSHGGRVRRSAWINAPCVVEGVVGVAAPVVPVLGSWPEADQAENVLRSVTAILEQYGLAGQPDRELIEDWGGGHQCGGG